jgi:hypothetical protein
VGEDRDGKIGGIVEDSSEEEEEPSRSELEGSPGKVIWMNLNQI